MSTRIFRVTVTHEFELAADNAYGAAAEAKHVVGTLTNASPLSGLVSDVTVTDVNVWEKP